MLNPNYYEGNCPLSGGPAKVGSVCSSPVQQEQCFADIVQASALCLLGFNWWPIVWRFSAGVEHPFFNERGNTLDKE